MKRKSKYMRPGGQPARADFFEHQGLPVPKEPLPQGYESPEPGLEAPAIDPVDLIGPGLLRGGATLAAKPAQWAARRAYLAKNVPGFAETFQAMGNPITNTARWLTGKVDDLAGSFQGSPALSAAEKGAEGMVKSGNDLISRMNRWRGSWAIHPHHYGKNPMHPTAVITGPRTSLENLTRLMGSSFEPNAYGKYLAHPSKKVGDAAYDVAMALTGRKDSLLHEAGGHPTLYRLMEDYGPEWVSDLLQRGVARRAGVPQEGIVDLMKRELLGAVDHLSKADPKWGKWASQYAPESAAGELHARGFAGQLGEISADYIASNPVLAAMVQAGVDVLPRSLRDSVPQAVTRAIMPSAPTAFGGY